MTAAAAPRDVKARFISPTSRRDGDARRREVGAEIRRAAELGAGEREGVARVVDEVDHAQAILARRCTGFEVVAQAQRDGCAAGLARLFGRKREAAGFVRQAEIGL